MARRPTPLPPAPKKTLTPDELRNGIKRLQTRIEELEAFDPNKMTESYPPDLQGLSTSIQTTLARVFGDGTADYQRFLPLANCNGVRRRSTTGACRPPRFLIT